MEKINYYDKYKNNHRYKEFEYRNCIICDYEFYAPKNIESIRTCSKYCKGRLLALHKLKGKYLLCRVCDKPIWCQPKKNRSFCSKRCADLGTTIFTNERNISRGKYKKYYGQNWHQQRRLARKRDLYVCQLCGINENEYGKELSVHHIKPFLLFDNYIEANDLNNLTSICEPCHRKTHSGDNHHSKYLK